MVNSTRDFAVFSEVTQADVDEALERLSKALESATHLKQCCKPF